MTQTAPAFDPIDLYQWRMREIQTVLDSARSPGTTNRLNRIREIVNMPNAAVSQEICENRRATEPNWQPPATAPVTVSVELPKPAFADDYVVRWKVPLTDVFTGDMLTGNRAGEVDYRNGRIGVTSMPSTLSTSGDAFRLAAALLAARDLMDAGHG